VNFGVCKIVNFLIAECSYLKNPGMALGYLFINVYFSPSRNEVTNPPGFLFNTCRSSAAELPSLYILTNLDGAKGGCFCAACDHLTVLINFNGEHIS
jgi:hypothetical protein